MTDNEKENIVTIDEMVQEVLENAQEKGLWDKVDLSRFYAHLMSEVCEALAECSAYGTERNEQLELADVVLMVMSYFGKQEWDLKSALLEKMKINKARSHVED